MRKLLFVVMLCVFSSTFAGEDKLNAVFQTVSQKLNQLEIQNHVDIGLSAIETYNNTHINFNANKRFPMDSTSKVLCAAALEYSDNGAVNQLMKILGGPNQVTQFARSIGDQKYFLVRLEPKLNSAIPNDKRDYCITRGVTKYFSQARAVGANSYSKNNSNSSFKNKCPFFVT